MQFRTMTAILVSAALVVTPAFAQTAGNTGPAEKPALRGAPATLPDATPMAPLKIDASAPFDFGIGGTFAPTCLLYTSTLPTKRIV